MRSPQIAEALRRGEIDAETIVWRDGIPEWIAIKAVPELAKLLPSSGMTSGAPVKPKSRVASPPEQAKGDEARDRPSVKPPLPTRLDVPEQDDDDEEEPVSLMPESVGQEMG